MTIHTSTTEEDPLDTALQIAVQRIRAEPVGKDSLERTERKALALANASSNSVIAIASTHDWLRRVALPSTVAASVLMCFALLWSQLSPSQAWAQVIKVVAAEPWMRLTLQKPTAHLPADIEFPEVEIWLNGERTVAAVKSPSGIRWVDVTKHQEHHYDAKTHRIGIGILDKDSQGELQALIAVLDCFQSGNRVESTLAHKVLDSKEKSISVNGQMLREFSFRLQRLKDNEQYTISVVVDGESKRPARMTWKGGQDAEKQFQRVFVTDFTDSGPGDIYALGVPQDAPVDDLRNLEKFFPERIPKTPDSYKATEIEVFAGWEGRWLNGITKYHLAGGALSTRIADPMQVVELAEKVRFGGDAEPDNSLHGLAWWISKAGDLDFSPIQKGGYNFPHNVCYAPYGDVRNYRSSHKSVLQGLEGTIELRGPKTSVWLDPERDLIVRRLETVADDGTISVSQYDEVVNDSQGNWFAKRWRSGRVAKRGEELADKAAGVHTVVHLCDIGFE